MEIRKAIRYAYPTSDRAKELGVSKTGGHYVAQSICRENGEWSPPFVAHGTGCEAFTRADDPDLLALLNEVDGEHYPAM